MELPKNPAEQIIPILAIVKFKSHSANGNAIETYPVSVKCAAITKPPTNIRK